jgi:hypothetical protein
MDACCAATPNAPAIMKQKTAAAFRTEMSLVDMGKLTPLLNFVG